MAGERVYCFLSRREGDSEELVTAGGQIPKNQDQFWQGFRALLKGLGSDFPPMKILKHGFAPARKIG
ncbi:hypothetical protein CXX84_10315 [Arthrobacter sp. AFG7.2]|nr:hypothetical protein CXX84_10315 [Arthrobacter sp. AFG7.2]